jgi:hypothetical protein
MRKRLLRRVCTVAAFIVFISSSGLYGSAQLSQVPSGATADLIRIDGMRTLGDLEKPPVDFLHDAHTQALASKKKDCSACHLTENDRLSIKFKRRQDTDRTTVMNIYHKECIACHGEMKITGEKTGPLECNECHKEKSRFVSSRQPVGMDKSLHYRHAVAQEQKCERCHHAYDDTAKKLFYAKGEEGTCRYCHRSETEENRISMRAASHIACVDCHLKNKAKNIFTGPVECAGCHDAAAQQKFEKIDTVPRMERKQPDAVLLKRAPKENPADNEILNRMSFVPFDHKAHEGYNNTCRACHHETLKACNECHTMSGTKQGKGVNLEKAMHQVDSTKSCRGCHLEKQNEKNCAGCHMFIGAPMKNKESACIPCHMKPALDNPLPSDPEQEKIMAAKMLQARTPVTETFGREDIPEKVVIKNLSKQYEAVDLPHRKIVNALAANIKDSKLAAYFHTEQGTLCQGCHHNSPVSKKPPACANCHGEQLDPQNPLKPGIMGAYHLQCMGCHKAMGIEKLAECTDCHKKKTN